MIEFHARDSRLLALNRYGDCESGPLIDRSLHLNISSEEFSKMLRNVKTQAHPFMNPGF